MRCRWRQLLLAALLLLAVASLRASRREHLAHAPGGPAGAAVARSERDTQQQPSGRPSLTIFTIFKEENSSTWAACHAGECGVGSVRAVRSWTRLPEVVVIVFGDLDTCAHLTSLLPLPAPHTCLPIPCFAADGSPTYDCIFAVAAETATTPALMYSNGDIFFFGDLVPAIQSIHASFLNYFLVGKRRDMEVRADLQRSETLTQAVNHNRNGIDYMVFPTATAPKLPPFLVGRIQWDQWTLLQAIAADTPTFEISDVVQVVHSNHGVSLASHNRSGSSINRELALHVPHPRVKELKVYHPGTIWLGRLDETMYLLTSPQSPASRSEDYYKPAVAPASSICPDCQVLFNNQSLELLLYKQHALVQDRRTVALVHVTPDNMALVPAFFCSAQAADVTNLLFITAEVCVRDALRRRGYPVYFHSSTDAVDSTDDHVLVFLDAMV